METPLLIETMIVTPTKDIPLEVYKECHRVAYFIEMMAKNEEGLVIWDEEATGMYCETMAEAEYMGLQNDWFTINMELPKEMVEGMIDEDEQ